MSGATWLAFLVASILISVSPGPGAVASMSSGARNGFPAGYWTAIGLQGGLLFQIAVVACGVGALLAASEEAFFVVKVLGAVYLGWLGLNLMRGASVDNGILQGAPEPPLGQMRRGLLVNVSNPKAIVFLLAVLPQFVDLKRSQAPQYTAMAVTMISVDLAVMAVYTGLGASLLAWFSAPRHRRAMNLVFGGLFLAAAVLLAFHKRAS